MGGSIDMNALVGFALRLRALMVALFALLMCGGLIGFLRLNIEAYPDPVPPLVDIVTQNSGQSAEEIERYITIPIEVGVATAPYLNAIRTISLFGLSDVKLQFTYDLTYEEAEQKVLNRLSQLATLPNQAQPSISPWSPIGEVYRYQVVGPPGYSLTDLKTLQDWVLARRFRSVPGVIDVTGWGGRSKTYEIEIDFSKLIAFGLTLPQVIQTLNNSNINVGGNTVNVGQQSAVVRGVGLIRSVADIRNTMLTQAAGTPVFLKDIAEVKVGSRPRLGIAGRDGEDDIVQGIVLMRRGQQSLPTIEARKTTMSASLRFLTMMDQTPEEMATTAGAPELLAIERGSEERRNPAATRPQAEMLRHIAPKEAQNQNGDQNGRHVKNNDVPIQAIAALQIAPAVRILGGISNLIGQHDHSSKKKWRAASTRRHPNSGPS